MDTPGPRQGRPLNRLRPPATLHLKPVLGDRLLAFQEELEDFLEITLSRQQVLEWLIENGLREVRKLNS